ncbi:aldolase/citrate lyase/malate synthase family protein [Spirosoma aerolatum]|uniref:hypothetical protein n=1 Tax=Spirosoma aerolatum TaxID=1211326 RepID=UPI001FE61142|nr:hypothetical protein [Spirosoma aerolatum]
MLTHLISIRDNLNETYSDVYTHEVIDALSALAPFNKRIKEVMDSRMKRRAARQESKTRISFLEPESLIPGTSIKVQDARDGKFEGAAIPTDLQRQWIQGTGPAAKPNAPVESSIRNVAYALLSGQTAGCSMAKTRWVRLPPCRSITSVT